MAYAAYREFPGASLPTVRRAATSPVVRDVLPTAVATSTFHVLDVTVACIDARRVRELVAGCPGAGVVRCEPLLHGCSSQESDAPLARLMIRLPLASYAQVLHCLIEAVPSGEIGRLVSWRDHLARCGLCHGR